MKKRIISESYTDSNKSEIIRMQNTVYRKEMESCSVSGEANDIKLSR